jgi:hypothetical protein
MDTKRPFHDVTYFSMLISVAGRERLGAERERKGRRI